MRTRAALSGVMVSVGILVVGWQIGVAQHAASLSAAPSTTGGTATGTSPGGTASPAPTTAPSAAASAAPAPAAAAPAPAAAASGTFAGSSVDTPYGSVQVQITVSGGKITDVTAMKLTDADGRSRQISNEAAPILKSEVLSSQSANVSNVSGATYTSQAYLQSVQSALDQAKL